MKLTSDIYSGFSKIFRATVSRGRFCVSVSQEITVYWCDWFYFTVEELNIDDIGNFQDSPRLVFTDEECGNLKVVNDGGELNVVGESISSATLWNIYCKHFSFDLFSME